LHPIWYFVTNFGDIAVTTPLALMATVVLALARQRRLITGWTLAVVGCGGTIAVLKILLAALGQHLAVTALESPSGHTAMSTLVYGSLALLIAAPLGRMPLRAIVYGAAALLVIAIAVSRVVLGLHSVVEVAFGLGVGAIAVLAFRAVLATVPANAVPVKGLAVGALVVVVALHGTRWPSERLLQNIARHLQAQRSTPNSLYQNPVKSSINSAITDRSGHVRGLDQDRRGATASIDASCDN
jgi:hypothetical protein